MSEDPKRLRTDQELKQIAMDLVEKQIFSSWHDNWHMSFTILKLMGKEELEKALKDVGFVYEYYDKAGPRAINNMPMFLSCHFIMVEQMPRFSQLVTELENAKKAFMEGE